MRSLGGVQRVPTFSEAQAHVPFPVVALDLAPEVISVRPEDRGLWATVRSLHTVEGARLRVKQFVYDWSDVSGLPTNVAHGRGNFYSKPEVLPVAGRPAFLGTDYKDNAAGFLSYWLVHVEVSNLTNRETAPIRRLLGTVRPALGDASRHLAARPIPLWSWVIRSGGRVWPDQLPTFARMRWFVDLREARTVPGLVRSVPSVEGFHFDSVGVTIPLADSDPWSCWLLRSDDLHSCIALWTETKEGKQPPFDQPKKGSFPEFWEGNVAGLKVQHYYQPLSGHGMIFHHAGERTFHAIFPTVWSPDLARDRERAATLFHALLGREGRA